MGSLLLASLLGSSLGLLSACAAMALALVIIAVDAETVFLGVLTGKLLLSVSWYALHYSKRSAQLPVHGLA